MATIQKRNESYRILFRYRGKRHTLKLGKVSRDEAESKANQIDYLLMRIKQKLLVVPPAVSIKDFMLHDGRFSDPVDNEPATQQISFGEFRDKYLSTHRNGALEQNSLGTLEIHLRHIQRSLGEDFPLQELRPSDLQGHIDRRVSKKLRGKHISSATLKKELGSFRTAWNWGVHMGLVQGPFPNKGLVYPKHDEKPPFQTWAEIERKLPGQSEREQRELWDCLFLTQKEITEFLAHIKDAAFQPWIYPAICFAAHTGVRRSEVIRVRVQDLDLDGGTVLIHEKKRAKGKRTTRRVPLSPFLAGVLRDWLKVHPGGQYLFCHEEEVARSKKRSRTTGYKGEKTRAKTLAARMASVRTRTARIGAGAITKDEAHDHFHRAIAGSKWQVLKGWHVLRHSFISNCAAKGVDQRLIDAWVGHQTEEMRKRYRHLIPSAEQAAIRAVFN